MNCSMTSEQAISSMGNGKGIGNYGLEIIGLSTK